MMINIVWVINIYQWFTIIYHVHYWKHQDASTPMARRQVLAWQRRSDAVWPATACGVRAEPHHLWLGRQSVWTCMSGYEQNPLNHVTVNSVQIQISKQLAHSFTCLWSRCRLRAYGLRMLQHPWQRKKHCSLPLTVRYRKYFFLNTLGSMLWYNNPPIASQ